MNCVQCESELCTVFLPCGHAACEECVQALVLADCGCTLCMARFTRDQLVACSAATDAAKVSKDMLERMERTKRECVAMQAHCIAKRDAAMRCFADQTQKLRETVRAVIARAQAVESAMLHEAKEVLKARLKAIDDSENLVRVHALQLDAMRSACVLNEPVLDALTKPLAIPWLPTQFEFVMQSDPEALQVHMDAAPVNRIESVYACVKDKHVFTCTAYDELNARVKLKSVQCFPDTCFVWEPTDGGFAFVLRVPNYTDMHTQVTATTLNGNTMCSFIKAPYSTEIFLHARMLSADAQAMISDVENCIMSDDGAFVACMKTDGVYVLDMSTLSVCQTYTSFKCAVWMGHALYLISADARVLVVDIDGVVPVREYVLDTPDPMAAMVDGDTLRISFGTSQQKDYDAALNPKASQPYKFCTLSNFHKSDGRTLYHNGYIHALVQGKVKHVFGEFGHGLMKQVRIGHVFYGCGGPHRTFSRRNAVEVFPVCPEVDTFVFHVASMDHLFLFTPTYVFTYKVNV